VTGIGTLMKCIELLGVIFAVLTFTQVMRKGWHGRLLWWAATVAFFALLSGVAFGEYYASTAPKRLRSIEKSNPDRAIQGYTEAIRFYPSDSELYVRRGATNLAIGRYGAAISDFTKSLERSPDDPSVLLMRGTTFMISRDFQSAERDFSKAAALNAGHQNPGALLGLAQIAAFQGNAEDVVSLSTQVLSIADNSSDRCGALMLRADGHTSTGNHENALRDLNQAESTCDEVFHAYILEKRGELYKHLNRPELALRDWNAAIQLKPDDFTLFLSRGNLLMSEGQFTQALSDFTRCIELRPEYPQGYAARAQAYAKLNQAERSEADLAKANKLLSISSGQTEVNIWSRSSPELPWLRIPAPSPGVH